jgi:uncharacterized protein YdhG (YjbR/CyaY superfamily)
MAQAKSRAVDDYIAAFPAPVRRVLERVRATIRTTVPDAVEAISYKIPAYKLQGKPLMYFAGWERHYALYPGGSRAVAAAFKEELARYEMSKGTIRFPLDEPVPVKLIERIAAFRASEVSAAVRSGRARRTAR